MQSIIRDEALGYRRVTSRVALRWFFLLIYFFIFSEAASRASAASPVTVYVVPDECSANAFDIDSFGRTMTIELRADGVDRVVVGHEDPVIRPHVVLDEVSAVITISSRPCDASAREIEITILGLGTQKKIQHEIALTDLDRPARPRAIALAVAELLRASWADLEMSPAPVAPIPISSATPAPSATPTPPKSESTSITKNEISDVAELDATMDVRFFPAYATTSFGATVSGSVRFAHDFPFRARFGVSAFFGSYDDPLGTISARYVGASAGVAFASSWRRIGFELGPQLELGDGWIGGRADVADVDSRWGSAPILIASGELVLHLRFFENFFVIANVDLGATLVSFSAETASGRAGGFAGWMAGAGLGIGRAF